MKTRKLFSILLTMLMLVGMVSVSATAEEESQVTITKTEIRADSVFNDGGYGSLKVQNGEGQTTTYPYSSPNSTALVDRSGKFLFPYIQTWLRYYYSDGIVSLVYPDNAYVQSDKIGFYNLDGSEVFECEYSGATPMINGYAFVTEWWAKEDASSYLIDSHGNRIFELDMNITGFGDSDQGIFFSSSPRAGYFRDGLLVCTTNERRFNEVFLYHYTMTTSVFYLNTAGETVLSFPGTKYNNAWPFSHGYAMVGSAENGKVGYIDKNGNEVIPCIYDDGGAFDDGLTYVKMDGKWGYINAQNETVIPFEYDAAYSAGGGLAAVGKDGKFGLVDYNNNIVVPLEYDDISSYDEGVAYAIKDGTVYIITGYTPSHPAGDIDGNGKVENSDLVTVARYIVGLTEGNIKAAVEAYADMNGDGRVDNQDIVTVARKIVGLE